MKGKSLDVVAYKGCVELYVTGDNEVVDQRISQNESWTGWEHMGGSVETKPSAVSWDDGKIDVYGGAADRRCRRCC